MVVVNDLYGGLVMAEKLYNPGRERPVRWYVFWWFATVHILGALGVVSLSYGWNWCTVGMAIALFFACHLSITAGVHRFYSHRAFKIPPWYERLILALFSATWQGDARWWTCRHREHHDHEDTELDPYTTKHGFWWAHWSWIIHDPGKIEPGRVPRDLARNNLLDWQEKYGLHMAIAIGLVLPALLAATWGDFVGGLLVGGFLRLTVQYHATWCINSVAHRFGSFRYVRVGTARTQGHWIAFPAITVGEGSAHERHHLAPEDYRIDPRWWALDVGKWAIWLSAALGIASKLRRVPEEAVVARAKKKAWVARSK